MPLAAITIPGWAGAAQGRIKGYIDRGFDAFKIKIGGAPSTKTCAGSRRR